MIKKSGSSYYLYSKDGSKKLGGPYNTRAAAVHREKQVTYFKNKAAGDPVPGAKSNAAPAQPVSSSSSSSRIDFLGIQAYSAPKPQNGFRTEKLHGRDYLVVPVTALIEGVIQGVTTSSPELALVTEFGKFPQGWNGRPVVMDHPEMMVDNQAFKVSANSPTILEKYQFGFLFNSKAEDKALKTEAWIDVQRAQRMNDNTRWVLDRLNTMEEGDSLEVSTGLFTGTENHQGKWNGKDYTAIWSGVVPDHLAFLPEGALGACSVADGCGAGYQTLRANCTGTCSCGGGEACSCGGKQMTKAKAKTSVPVVPRKPTVLSELIANAREAPSSETVVGGPKNPYRPAPQDVGPAQKPDMSTSGLDSDNHAGSMVTFLDWVESDASGIGKGHFENDDGDDDEGDENDNNAFRKDTDITRRKKSKVVLSNDYGPKTMPAGGSTPELDINAAAAVALTAVEDAIRDHLGAPEGLMDSDVRTILQNGIRKAFPSGYPYVVGFTPSTVVYNSYDADDGSYGYFQTSYDIDDDTKAVKFGDECSEVMLTTSITPLSEEDENPSGMGLFDNAAGLADHIRTNAMNAQEARKFLSAFGHTEAALKSMEDPRVLELARGVAKTINDLKRKLPKGKKGSSNQPGNLMEKDSTAIEDQDADDMDGKELTEGTEDAPQASVGGNGRNQQRQTLDQLLAQASPDLRESIQAGVRMHAARKEQVIKDLIKTNRCRFTEEELKSFSISYLENLADLANVPQDYSGLNRTPAPRTQQSRGTGFAPPPPKLVIHKGGKSKSAYEAGGPGYNGNDDGEDEGEYDGTGADGDVNVKRTKKRSVAND